MTVESLRADTFIVERLKADAALTAKVAGRIYADVAPQSAFYPFIVFSEVSNFESLAAGGDKVMARPLYQVKVLDRSTSWQGDIRTVADRVDAVLHKSAGAAGTDGYMVGILREATFRTVEVNPDNGEQYRTLILQFRAWVQET